MQQQTIFDVIKKRDFQTLYQHKKEILTQNQYGYTPLIYAIVKKVDIGMIKALLSMQPDLEQTDKMGDTALKKAIKFQNYFWRMGQILHICFCKQNVPFV